jgi:hypothetical protein
MAFFLLFAMPFVRLACGASKPPGRAGLVTPFVPTLPPFKRDLFHSRPYLLREASFFAAPLRGGVTAPLLGRIWRTPAGDALPRRSD